MVSDMTSLLLSYALFQIPLAMAARPTDFEQAVAIGTARTDSAIVDGAFVDWQSRDRAQPFQARFSTPITMKKGRAQALTMFLDMSAFVDVWNRCLPANRRKENQP